MLDRRPLGNIVVAIDFSDGAQLALERACRLPIAPGAALTLLHVMPRLHPSLFARAERAARTRLEAWAEEARAKLGSDVGVRVAVESGEPHVEIDACVEAARAELVVLGRRGRRAWPGEALGSTADHVLRHGRRATLIASDPTLRPYERPLAGVDEEGSATAAIELMTRIVARHVRGALAVHVIDVDAYWALSEYGVSDAEIEPYRRAEVAATRRKIDAALDELGATELDFDLRFVEGSPREAIVKSARAEAADLIVVGTHGRRGVGHLLLGSVAEAVIRHATVDVLVAPTARA